MLCCNTKKAITSQRKIQAILEHLFPIQTVSIYSLFGLHLHLPFQCVSDYIDGTYLYKKMEDDTFFALEFVFTETFPSVILDVLFKVF